MSDLAAEHARQLDIVARDAGLLVQPTRRGKRAGWPTSRPFCASTALQMAVLEDEFYRDACDSSAARASEGDAIRSVWSD